MFLFNTVRSTLLTLATCVGIGTVFHVVVTEPANAAPSVCWLSTNAGPDGRLPAQSCDVHTRRNANGHIVHDVTTHNDGARMTVVLWTNEHRAPSYAESFYRGRRILSNYRWDDAGDVHLYGRDLGNESMYFRTTY